MMPVIRIPDSVFERLQSHAKPFIDTPASVIERLLDSYEKNLGRQTHSVDRLASAQELQHDKVGSGAALLTSPSGFWFANVGENDYRNWDDCVRYGFLAAGWHPSTDRLARLATGYKLFAYMKGRGYVGYGEVLQPAQPVKDFTPAGADRALLELPLRALNMGHDRDDPDNSEWVVSMRWHKTFPREEAKRFPGIFANQNIACRLRDERTLEFLRREFDVG